MPRAIVVAALVFLLGAPAAAQSVVLDGAARQGGLVFGRTEPGSSVTFAGRDVRVTAAGRFVLGFGRDAPPRETLTVRTPSGVKERIEIPVVQRTYDVQRIDGLPPATVTPRTEEQLAQIDRERRLIGAVRRRDSAQDDFLDPPIWPTVGPISGVFGSQRILNGEPRAPHRGVDVAAPRGTPVNAMAGGTVALARPDMYFTGGTVFIDHGHGLVSVYAHMDRVDVLDGQTVRLGEPIGTIGATGRVTGPHLHWGVFWFDRAIDPATLVAPMPDVAAGG